MSAGLESTLQSLQQPLFQKLAAAERMVLRALITLVVGQLNVAKALIEAAAVSSFDSLWQTWNSYTRHYRVPDGVSVRCDDHDLPYGFNYSYGQILVATPLTHEVYRASMAALSFGMVFLSGP